MIIPTIVTTAHLRDHLRLSQPTGSPPVALPDEADLQLKLDAATELICRYIADRHPADPAWRAEIASWDLSTNPPPIVIMLAVLEQAAEFFRFRGDDENPVPRQPGMLSPAIENLVSRYKNRAFA